MHPPKIRYKASNTDDRLKKIISSGVIIGLLISSFVVLLYWWIANPGKRASWKENPESVYKDEGIKPDWIETKEYYEKLITTKVSTKYQERCKQVMRGEKGFAFSNQDVFLFHTFFKQLKEPGVYLQIGGAKEAIEGSNTVFLDQCLGWKGVVINTGPNSHKLAYANRNARVIDACISQSTNGKKKAESRCKTFEEILSLNSDILGSKDDDGRWGLNINYVTLNIEANEPALLGCTDLKGLFSPLPKIQVWSIRTNTLNGPNLRVVDASMLLAGYIKATPFLSIERGFLDDIYLMARSVVIGGAGILAQYQCPSGNSSCALAELASGAGTVRSLRCDD
jgi:hypothetical protein